MGPPEDIALNMNDRVRECEHRIRYCEGQLRLLVEERAAHRLLVLGAGRVWAEVAGFRLRSPCPARPFFREVAGSGQHLVLRIKLGALAAITILSAYLATVHGWWAP